LTPMAMLYTVPQKVRLEIGLPFWSWITCHDWMTRERRMVVPMLVPANCPR
jgi:hypothetical protein